MKIVTAFDEDTGRFTALGLPKNHPVSMNEYKSDDEAQRAFRLWSQSVKPKPSQPSRARVPFLREARKRGVCMQCFGQAGAEPRKYRSWGFPETHLPMLTAYGMNLCPRCFAIYESSAKHWIPNEEFPTAG